MPDRRGEAQAEPGKRLTRRVVTVLSAELADGGHGADPEVARAEAARALEPARRALEAHGGTVRELPDGTLMGLFGIPLAHEDDALRALRAAVELREAGLVARAGVDTGLALAAGGEASGDVVRMAAQLRDAAAGGEIVVGEQTRILVGEAVRLDPRWDERLAAWRLVEVPAPGGRDAALVAPRRPRGRARAAARGARAGGELRAGAARDRHRRGRDRQVPAGAGAGRPGSGRGRRARRPVPGLRRGDHVLAAPQRGQGGRRHLVRGDPGAARGRAQRRRHRQEGRGRDRAARHGASDRGGPLGRPPAAGGARREAPARDRLRRPLLGGAGLPRSRRPPDRGHAGAHPPRLPRPLGAARGAAGLGTVALVGRGADCWARSPARRARSSWTASSIRALSSRPTGAGSSPRRTATPCSSSSWPRSPRSGRRPTATARSRPRSGRCSPPGSTGSRRARGRSSSAPPWPGARSGSTPSASSCRPAARPAWGATSTRSSAATCSSPGGPPSRSCAPSASATRSSRTSPTTRCRSSGARRSTSGWPGGSSMRPARPWDRRTGASATTSSRRAGTGPSWDRRTRRAPRSRPARQASSLRRQAGRAPAGTRARPPRSSRGRVGSCRAATRSGAGSCRSSAWSSSEAGDPVAAEAALAEAIDDAVAASDRRIELRARLELAAIHGFTAPQDRGGGDRGDRGGGDPRLRAGRRPRLARPGLARPRLRRRLGRPLGRRRRPPSSAALEHAREAGDAREEAALVRWLARSILFGSTPAPDGHRALPQPARRPPRPARRRGGRPRGAGEPAGDVRGVRRGARALRQRRAYLRRAGPEGAPGPPDRGRDAHRAARRRPRGGRARASRRLRDLRLPRRAGLRRGRGGQPRPPHLRGGARGRGRAARPGRRGVGGRRAT